MRIIAGQAKGLTIKSPRGESTRPMDGRTRGALFNILVSRLDGAAVLDLYAGSGALGLEALSRGAQCCIFVEKNRAASRIIEENLVRSRMAGGEVLAMPSALAVKTLQARDERFSMMFFDPPFPLSRSPETRASLFRELASATQMLAPDGLAVWRLEPRNYYPQELPASLQSVDRREYGRSLLVFLAPAERGGQVESGEPA
jgi:16S rRNA (guanine966-N2)-methyltransferase